MWVTRFQLTSKDNIKQFITDAKNNGINNIFVQVRGGGQCFYKSEVEQRADVVTSDFDPLEYAVDQAHRNGLKIHAWVNMFYVWSKHEDPPISHIAGIHSDWLIKDKYGNSDNVEGLFLNPADKNVQSYLTSICIEIAKKYNINGLHLDYIRYPNASFGNENGNDIRCQQITGLVESIYYKLSHVNSNVELSAAVYPDITLAKLQKAQDWKKWLESGILDFVVPMAYRKTNEQFKDEMSAAAAIKTNKYILAGIGTYLVSREVFSQQVKTVRDIEKTYPKLKGWVLFSYDFLKSNRDYWNEIK